MFRDRGNPIGEKEMPGAWGREGEQSSVEGRRGEWRGVERLVSLKQFINSDSH